MQDRVPTYPGRVTLTPVPGQANTYDLVRADDPTQEGTPLNKATFLQDSTCALLDLPNTAVPNDAFAKLALGTGMYGYLITVVDGFGNPVAGMTVDGIQNRTGGACITDENGQALGVSTETSVSVSVTSPYFDLDSASQTVQSTGIITSAALTMAVKYEANQSVTINTSRTIKFSPAVDEVDFCGIGGGGGGMGGDLFSAGGGGGGGGNVINLLDYSVSSSDSFSLVIGSGGNPGGSSTSPGSGGTTTIAKNGENILTASGGNGADFRRANIATGNGNGGLLGMYSRISATNGNVNLFNDPSLGLPGGGGGGPGAYRNNSSTTVYPGEPGGLPYGGSGGQQDMNGSAATGPGGGGAGGGFSMSTEHITRGGAGSDGAIIIRMRYAA